VGYYTSPKDEEIQNLSVQLESQQVQLSELQNQLAQIQEQLANGNFQINVSNYSGKIKEVEIVEESVKPTNLFSVLLRKFNNILGIRE